LCPVVSCNTHVQNRRRGRVLPYSVALPGQQLPGPDIFSVRVLVPGGRVCGTFCGIAVVAVFSGLLAGRTLVFASNIAPVWGPGSTIFIWQAVSGVVHLVKIFGVLVPTQMLWTLANYVLTTREAKRVFGMVVGRHRGLDLFRLFSPRR